MDAIQRTCHTVCPWTWLDMLYGWCKSGFTFQKWRDSTHEHWCNNIYNFYKYLHITFQYLLSYDFVSYSKRFGWKLLVLWTREWLPAFEALCGKPLLVKVSQWRPGPELKGLFTNLSFAKTMLHRKEKLRFRIRGTVSDSEPGTQKQDGGKKFNCSLQRINSDKVIGPEGRGIRYIHVHLDQANRYLSPPRASLDGVVVR